ncbi:hypothetical protein FNV43_RR13049 [Rhamnella rubrinervis]|uniref:WLM domain-containing protein n=1 Tax=Rhamnella rubrinervis TaxID=2594499 RepID=A0A8K0H0D0_9ROSA|nr:hypothetical protein FNV43_RR13049 [Rhamnella rubrinervis]
MAISRGLVLFCLGTLWVSCLLIKVTEAEHSEYVDIHSVKHEGGSEGCKSTDPNKGNQCDDDEEGIEVDDDFDDTYKVVNKVKVSLSGLGISAGKMTSGDGFEDSYAEDLEHNERVINNMQDPQSINISVIWRGKKFIIGMSPSATIKELGHEMQKLTDVKADTMRLIVPQNSNKCSKLLFPFSDEHERLILQETSIIEGKSIRMMGVSDNEIDQVLEGAKANFRIAGFDDEERRLRQRMSDTPHASLRLPQGPYIFCDFRTLQLPGIELNPPASEALKRMHMLAADPGIIAVMNKHRWRVGIMTEMAPVGYVGISPKCLLGFNKNHGEEISLRLRTDDLKGFRKYESIKKTLLHELAHMVYSEHDADFYAMDRQLNQEAASLDWTRSRSHTLTGVKHSEHYDEDFFVREGISFTQKIGGNMSDQLATARASSVAAAYRRFPNFSINGLEISEVHEEPDLDDSGFHTHEEHSHMDSAKSNIDSSTNPHSKPDQEPDPDDLSDYQNKFEPDPDDSQGDETFVSESFHSEFPGSKTIYEPSYIVSGETQLVSITNSMLEATESCEEPNHDMEILDSKIQGQENVDEPDPDDLELKLDNLGYGNGTSPEDDSAEPDPDDNLVHPWENSKMQIDEPDPDDEELQRIQDPVTVICSQLQKVIEVLRAEVNPMQATIILQTLFKIIRNVIEFPDELKYKRLRKANPIIERNIAKYKAAMELLFLVGFSEDVVSDEIGKTETYLVLKRNDPGLLWLAKSSLEMSITC